MPGKFPVQYQRNAMASTLASMLVYQEGIHLVESQPDRDLANRALQYYREHVAIQKLVSELEASEWVGVPPAEKAEALSLLADGGARTNMGIF